MFSATTGSLLLLLLFRSTAVHAISQTAQVNVQLSNGASYSIYASQASFGSYPKMGVENNEAHLLSLAPRNNPLLCRNDTNIDPVLSGTFVMVPRGECTFETKAMNAQRMGAAGLIVRGSLTSRYSLNETTNEVIYPSEFNDFDCSKGRAEIPASAISLTPAYNSDIDDALLSGTSASNLCLANSPDRLEMCASKACLLTGNKTAGGNFVACCAWDMHVWLYNDPTFGPDDVTIPAVYVTLQQGEQLLQDMQTSHIHVIVSSRVRASYNISAILIWALGVFVCAVAAYSSAGDYRTMTAVMTKRAQAHSLESDNMSANGDSNGEQVALTSPQNRTNMQQGEEQLELGAGHALGFIVLASSGLLFLFFFKVRAIDVHTPVSKRRKTLILVSYYRFTALSRLCTGLGVPVQSCKSSSSQSFRKSFAAFASPIRSSFKPRLRT